MHIDSYTLYTHMSKHGHVQCFLFINGKAYSSIWTCSVSRCNCMSIDRIITLSKHAERVPLAGLFYS